jgi:hypothetical protein
MRPSSGQVCWEGEESGQENVFLIQVDRLSWHRPISRHPSSGLQFRQDTHSFSRHLVTMKERPENSQGCQPPHCRDFASNHQTQNLVLCQTNTQDLLELLLAGFLLLAAKRISDKYTQQIT